jgi:hypothetical protein
MRPRLANTDRDTPLIEIEIAKLPPVSYRPPVPKNRNNTTTF